MKVNAREYGSIIVPKMYVGIVDGHSGILVFLPVGVVTKHQFLSHLFYAHAFACQKYD
jgi:hypothetical protein